MKKYVFALSGASGQIFGLRVLRELARTGAELHVVVSPTALKIIKDEAGVDWSGSSEAEIAEKVRESMVSPHIKCWSNSNFEAPVASGSFKADGMFIVPCSMKTLAGVANGYAGSLIERAADVTIKEGRRLLVSPREMPFSAIHLENMLKLARLGVVVAPPVPGFYHGPADLDGLVDFIAGKILDAFGVEHDLFKRWQGRHGDI